METPQLETGAALSEGLRFPTFPFLQGTIHETLGPGTIFGRGPQSDLMQAGNEAMRAK